MVVAVGTVAEEWRETVGWVTVAPEGRAMAVGELAAGRLEAVGCLAANVASVVGGWEMEMGEAAMVLVQPPQQLECAGRPQSLEAERERNETKRRSCSQCVSW